MVTVDDAAMPGKATSGVPIEVIEPGMPEATHVAALLHPESFRAVKVDPFAFDPEVLDPAFDLWAAGSGVLRYA